MRTCLNVTLDDCMYGEFVHGTTCISFISMFSNFSEEEAILEI